MRAVRLGSRATQDLAEIGRFTQRHWGTAQRRKYLVAIASRIEALLRSTAGSSTRDNISPGLRSVRSGRHLIFYRSLEESVIVVRILHEAMDIAQHSFDEE